MNYKRVPLNRLDINIYDMKMHEMQAVEDGNLFTTTLRVPGGWMYRSYDKEHNMLTSVFVPYNLEFDPEWIK